MKCTQGAHLNHNPAVRKDIYLTDSDEVAIVDFVEDHDELYEKTNKLI